MDLFTGNVWLRAVPYKSGVPSTCHVSYDLSAAECVTPIVRALFGDLAGQVRILHTDNGREFCNEEMEQTCTDWKVDHRTGAPYHPQSQGKVENRNKQVKAKLLAKLHELKRGEWNKLLPTIQGQSCRALYVILHVYSRAEQHVH